MKYKGTLLAVVVTLLLLPSASSLGCKYLSDEEKSLCQTIDKLDATKGEKEVLLNSIIYQDKTSPNHDFAYEWNSKISMSSPPEGISTRNEGVIRNAWVKIISISSSVLENGTLYVDSSGKIKTEYNYYIELPSGTESGDCETEYSLAGKNEKLLIYLNDGLIGRDKLTQFNNPVENKHFTARLEIEAQVKVEHYKKVKVGRRTKCRHYDSEIRTSWIALEDHLEAKKSPHNPTYNFQILNQYSSSTKGKVNASDYTSFLLKFANSEYKKTNYVYDYVYSLAPYNVLTIRAIPLEQESSRNINIKPVLDRFEFIVKDKNNCQISLLTHFTRKDFTCLPEFQSKNIKIKTDDIHYFQNDSILIDIEPKGLEVDLEYANQTFKVKNSILLRADPKYSRVRASYGDEISEKVISVTEKSNFVTATKILLFFFINYVTFAFLTKETWILKWLNVAS